MGKISRIFFLQDIFTAFNVYNVQCQIWQLNELRIDATFWMVRRNCTPQTTIQHSALTQNYEHLKMTILLPKGNDIKILYTKWFLNY